MIGWVREQHTDEQIAFLHGLPARLELDVDGVGQVLFCHATPQNDTDIFSTLTILFFISSQYQCSAFA